MAENLKKTILIENEEYNINAVYSDEAGKVTTPLVIKESGVNVGKYYGSTDTSETTKSEINYVPATGGTFTGPVNIYTNKTDVTDVTDSEIINYGQVDHIVSKLTGAPLYTWDVNTGYNAKTDSTGTDYKLNTVIGTVEDLLIFEAYSEGKAHNKYITPDSYDKAYMQYTETNEAWFNPGYMNIKDTITKLVIPGTNNGKSVKIKENAFQPYDTNDTKTFDRLETVHINPGVTAIGQAAFKDCDVLKSIAIPDSVESIGGWAFENCTSLATIILGSKITSIPNGTFKNSGIKSIFIGSGVSNIHDKAFLSCDSLEKIYFAGTEANWDRVTGCTKDASATFKNLIITKTGEIKKTIPVICIDNVNHPAAPFLYICKGADSEDTSLTSNKIFLKLPGQALVEVSKGAVRLERWDSKPNNNTDYFTYDVLAAVIAGINSRLTALGSKALALPEKLIVSNTEHIAVPEISDDIIPADDKSIIVEETVVPTVQQLQQQLTNITGLTQNDDYANNNYKTTSVMQANADGDGYEIRSNYYQVGGERRMTSGQLIGNSIRIKDFIPTSDSNKTNYVEGNVGDIIIVI